MDSANTEFPTLTASSVSKTHIVFQCPYHDRKNPTYHKHGSRGDLSNRTVHKISHCHECPKAFDQGYFLQITDETIRK